jgi:transposase-like protein
MKPNLPLQACMLRLYQRYKQSQKTRAAFCREEGITAAQFTYWCRRFEQESTAADACPTSITLSQVSTPIEAVQEPVAKKTYAANPVAEPIPATSSSFTQLHLPDTSTPAAHSVCLTEVVSTRPLIVLDLAGKGRVEFYTPVEADYLKALLS